jgi:hypothetical protein
MTESEWRTGTDTEAMLEFLRGRISSRKLRLFACACVRLVWHLLPEPVHRYREAIAFAEDLADGRRTPWERDELVGQLQRTMGAAWQERYLGRYALTRTVHAVHEALSNSSRRAAAEVVRYVSMALREDAVREGGPAWRHAPADVLRHLVGDPFRPVRIELAWRAWQAGAVVKIASAIYDERRFEDLPVLADALEEAGCDSADLLGHCRAAGGHVRGCWAVDLVLDRS